ncbi:MAG: hypothetical protein KZQ83_20505 [gamma proteobacterium symbiont of Taylorina sp.]|nr:hypothetical protein [gamma proteobacterium symbiont of Taylorina sp.]
MDSGNLIDGISKEIKMTLESMEKVKTPEERLMHSETLKNLCQSLDVFLNLLNNVDNFDYDEDFFDVDDDDGKPIPF